MSDSAEYTPYNPSWLRESPVLIEAGCGAINRLPSLILNLIPDLFSTRKHILIVTTAGSTKRGLTKRVQDLCCLKQVGQQYDKQLDQQLDNSPLITVSDQVIPNPDLITLTRLTEYLLNSDKKIDLIIGAGGGSVIDTAKILSITLALEDRDDLWAQRFSRGLSLRGDQGWSSHIPVIAIPTTAGTGAEVTPFATLWDTENKSKLSVHGPLVAPALALLDPTLTYTLPPSDTLHTALDTISHALESIWNINRTPLSTAHSVQALDLALQAITQLTNPNTDSDGRPEAARADMLYASTLAGLAISKAKTALAHAISYPLTAHFGVPHGLACSFTLADLIRANFQLLDDTIGSPKLINQTLDFLDSLNLAGLISSYLPADATSQLPFDNLDPDRAGNFSGTLPCSIREFVSKSLSPKESEAQLLL